MAGRCPTCRHRLLDDADGWCGRCGSATGQPLELDGGAGGPAVTRATVTTGPSRVGTVVLVALVGIVVAAGVASGRGGTPEPGRAPTTAPTAPTTPTTQRPWAALPADADLGPQLGHVTATVVWFVHAGTLVRFDLDTGHLHAVGPVKAVATARVMAHRGLVAAGAGDHLSTWDGRVMRTLAGTSLVPANDEAAWIFDTQQGRPVLRSLPPGNTTDGDIVALPAGTWPLLVEGDGSVAIAVEGSGIYRFDPATATASRVAGGSPLAAGAGRVAYAACDEQLVCGVRVVDLRTGTDRAVVVGLDGGDVLAAALSPDGQYLALVSAPGTPAVLDVFDVSATSTVAHHVLGDDPALVLGAAAGLWPHVAWTLDGSHVLVGTADGLLAFGLRGREPVRLGDPVLGAVGSFAVTGT